MAFAKLRQNLRMLNPTPCRSKAFRLFFCLAACWSLTASAETSVWGGRPALGLALERETSSDKSQIADTLTIAPGLRFTNGGVNRIDVLIQTERDTDNSSGTDTFTRFNGLAVRVRKDLALVDKLDMYFTGLAGRTQGNDTHFWYGYSEAGFMARLGGLNFSLGTRVHRSLDGNTDQNFNKLLVGPGFVLGDQHELDLRWMRSWRADGNAFDSDAVKLEYIYKF